MTYAETIEFMFSQLPAYHRIGKAAYKANLDNTIAMDNYLNNPHKKFRSIHVAGTNGKGSVSHMLASVLQEAGYKTGLYTSPHLRDFRERIRVDGMMIPEEAVVTFVSSNKSIIEALVPSFFEMTVAMAYDYFAKSKVDVAVVEVGLGGRLDSTNIIRPVLSVITNIGHDHMDLLGDTIEKIALEKAGIIKAGVPVVISETQADTRKIFISKARENDSDIFFADEKFSCSLHDTDALSGERKYVITEIDSGIETEGQTLLGGDYQAKNLTGVFCACKELKKMLDISDNNILSGILNVYKNTGLEGRWQILRINPLTICDTGHNMEGLEYVTNQLRRLRGTLLHIVIGFANDKELKSILPLFPADAIYYFTRASVTRAMDEFALRDEASNYGLAGDCFPDVKTAIHYAERSAAQSDVIFIGGSTFIVADALLAI
jgi:dihydrofolate synthase/folylpolyglutamate synthase